MAKTLVGGAADDIPIDPRVFAPIRDAMAAMAMPDLAAIALWQANLADLSRSISAQFQHVNLLPAPVLPRLDLVPLTHVHEALAQLAASVQRDMLKLPQLDEMTRTFQRIAASVAPKLDLSAFAVFDQVAESMSESPVAELEQLADELDQVLPGRSVDAELADQDLVRWAASIELELEVTATADTAADELERFRDHLSAVAAWLYTSAAQLRAGAQRLNRSVDAVNTNAQRYDDLAGNVLKLYFAIIVIRHFIG